MKITGSKIEIKEPRYGIKFKKKANIANEIAKSFFKKNKIKNVENAVKKLVKAFIWK